MTRSANPLLRSQLGYADAGRTNEGYMMRRLDEYEVKKTIDIATWRYSYPTSTAYRAHALLRLHPNVPEPRVNRKRSIYALRRLLVRVLVSLGVRLRGFGNPTWTSRQASTSWMRKLFMANGGNGLNLAMSLMS